MLKPKPFRNEAVLDFSKPKNRKAQAAALAKARRQFGREYPIIIGGKEIKTRDKLRSLNPANHKEVIGVFQKGTQELALKALDNGWKTFETWKRVPAEKRARYAFKAADIMRKRRFEVNAWMIIEAGKSWVEADADTAEAIDFLDFYGHEILRYSAKQPITPLKGEDNQLFYIPLGVGLSIPPWNFPNAILVGMTSAAWITGNTVILKPASTTPMMGWLYMDILRQAGVPGGVVNFLPGPGSKIGNTLVEHPKTRFICFTGSKEVGLQITETAAKHRPGQIWIKRVVAEMGGKDGIIVDSQADLEAAATGVAFSAFGYQGQKCSACSRAIVDAKVYDRFIEKLIPKVEAMTMGDTTQDPSIYMGPVIDKPAYDKIMSYMKVGAKEGKLLTGGMGDDSTGYYIEPTVFKDISPTARLAQEEIFGPILAVIKARDWKHALQIANNTEFGLTGSVYTKSKRKAKEAIQEFHVGNFYINRKSTGALVGVHPFGGFNMSGTDSKAGGRDYLALFLQAKTVSEKLK